MDERRRSVPRRPCGRARGPRAVPARRDVAGRPRRRRRARRPPARTATRIATPPAARCSTAAGVRSALDLKDEGDREVAAAPRSTAPTSSSTRSAPACSSASAWVRTCARARNPRYLVARMTGWGQDGPRAATPGTTSTTSPSPAACTRSGPPATCPSPRSTSSPTSAAAGCCSRSASLAALLERERSGRGQVVDVAMVDGVGAAHELRLAGAGRRALGAGRAGATGCRAPRPGTAPTRRRTARSSPSARTSRSSTRSCSSASVWTPRPGRSGTATAGRR